MSIDPLPAPAAAPRPAPAIESARRVLAHEARALGILDEALGGPLGSAFSAAIETVLGLAGRVMVTGVGKSGHVGRKIAATLASTGTPASFVHASEASHGDLGMITRADAVLALSWSGESAELRDVIDYCRRFAVP
ncbi:MAG: SIS domain-containing protein, partial [Pseudomonadota bacterium]